jgi:uncharacterized protein YndB with AHSA1/START domain
VAREVRLHHVVAAPREAAFRAWTTPDELRRWWGPGEFTTLSAEIDLRPGGMYRLVLQPPGGPPLHLGGTYREVDPPRRLVYTWQWLSGVPDTRESLVTVEFEDLGPSTRVTVIHNGFDEDSPTAPYESGWRSGLAKLADLLAEVGNSHTGREWCLTLNIG